MYADKVPGAVSGPKGCLVMLQDALKKPWIEPPPLVRAIPAAVIEAATVTPEAVAVPA
jgi:hypothetical protein